MLITRKNYSACLERLEAEESRLCEQLMMMFKACGINELNMGCVGNSIMSGYSKCDEMLPFFARSKLYHLNEGINFYSFARIRRNEESNVLKWYNQNYSHTYINQLLLSDLQAKEGKYAFWGQKQREEYLKLAGTSSIGFQDYIKLPNNIVIYGGLSGTFTDILRKGNASDRKQILKSFKKDHEYLKMLLTQLYMDNPEVEIYICGLPNMLGINLSNLFDKYIRDAISVVPNSVYVKGAAKNIFMTQENQKEPDYHYNKPEYLYQLCEIWKSILKNHIPNKFKNEVLLRLAEYSDEVEKKDTTSKGTCAEIEEIIENCEKKHGDLLNAYDFDVKKIKVEIWKYYNRNYLLHYGCTNRKYAREILLGK